MHSGAQCPWLHGRVGAEVRRLSRSSSLRDRLTVFHLSLRSISVPPLAIEATLHSRLTHTAQCYRIKVESLFMAPAVNLRHLSFDPLT